MPVDNESAASCCDGNDPGCICNTVNGEEIDLDATLAGALEIMALLLNISASADRLLAVLDEE